MSIRFAARHVLQLCLLPLGLALGSTAAQGVESAAKPARATLAQVYTAETLYTCPMHPAVLSADPKLDCPRCEMHLAPLGAEARAALLAEPLVGCPMDPIVMPAKDAKPCPVCGMKLTALAAPAAGAAAAPTAAPAACCKAGEAGKSAGCCKPSSEKPSGHDGHKH